MIETVEQYITSIPIEWRILIGVTITGLSLWFAFTLDEEYFK